MPLWHPPSSKATQSKDALLWEQWITGEYWVRHRIAANDRPSMPGGQLRAFCWSSGRYRRLEPFRGFDIPPPLKPWRTVRDALSGLPDPEFDEASCRRIPNHQFNPGARVYAGHTGSRYDEPAKVLKAGDHGVPGGENMLAREDGTCRYFSVREAARLQTFPDSYVFPGSFPDLGRKPCVKSAMRSRSHLAKRSPMESGIVWRRPNRDSASPCEVP